MKYSIKRFTELKTARWAGGTTTELVIYPESSEFKNYNFVFRISYATVEVPSSTFTLMTGVTRHLMILEGQLTINHTGRYSKKLNPFDQDVFNGEWPTTAEGMVKDFNLLLREGASGALRHHQLANGETSVIDCSAADVLGIYIQRGNASVNGLADHDEKLNAGDFIYITSNKTAKQFSLAATAKADLVVVEVNLPAKMER